MMAALLQNLRYALRPLAYDQPHRIVAITTQWRTTGLRGSVSAPDFHDSPQRRRSRRWRNGAPNPFYCRVSVSVDPVSGGVHVLEVIAIGPSSVDVAPRLTAIVPLNCPTHVGRVGMPPGPTEMT